MAEHSAEHEVLSRLADLLDQCEPDDHEHVTWGALRRQMRLALRTRKVLIPAISVAPGSPCRHGRRYCEDCNEGDGL